MKTEKYNFGPISLPPDREFDKARLEIYGINHFRPSYSVRVFFNDKKVNKNTCTDDRESYAGTFSIFGHAQCAGDDGHCHVPTGQRRFDTRPSHPLTRAFKRIDVTQALKRVINDNADELTITVFVAAENVEFEGKHLLDIQGMQLVTTDNCNRDY